jgi:hypothetical protein
MKRVGVVLVLLAANAVFGTSKQTASETAPAELTVALKSSEHGRLGCVATGRPAWSIRTAGETPALYTGGDARAPLRTPAL